MCLFYSELPRRKQFSVRAVGDGSAGELVVSSFLKVSNIVSHVVEKALVIYTNVYCAILVLLIKGM